MKPEVSWLMPVYHAEKTVERAIQSMINQTFQDFEIIIVLEPGDDKTEEICTRYADQDDRIQVLKNKRRLGIAGSLNAGLEICQGAYIARMDADDISYSERLAKQVAYMQAHPETGLLGTNLRIIKNDGSEKIRYDVIPDSETIRAWLLFETCFSHPTIMLRKEAYAWKYPMETAEDYALFAEVISKVKMEILPDVLLDYMESGENACIIGFEASRESSYRISRKAIENELGIDTSIYEDSHFGWRFSDDMPKNPMRFMRDSIKLLQSIRAENQKRKVFNADALDRRLETMWDLSKHLVRPYNNIPLLHRVYHELTEQDISYLEFYLELYTDRNKKIILYGTGKDGDTIAKQAEHDNIPITAFCDSDHEKQGKDFHGKPIVSPQQIGEMDYDAIWITTKKYAHEIRSILVDQYNISDNVIYELSPLIYELCSQVDNYILAFHRRRNGRIRKYNQTENKGRTWLFCAADYCNLGDHAIAEAEHDFFSKRLGMELLEVPHAEYRSVAKYVIEKVRTEDLLLITGGGFLGSLWIDGEKQVRDIIRRFPKNPVCILPQTLYWENGDRWEIERQQTAKVYHEHTGKLLLCARDDKSEQLMHEYYKGCSICTCPDMTLSMDWSGYFNKETRKGAILCLKDDKESVLNEEEKTFLTEVGVQTCKEVSVCTTIISGYFAEEERTSLLREKLCEFAKAELVITDRLHGVLFSAVTGTSCIALDNCNHKICETFKWVENINNIRYVRDILEIEQAVEKVLKHRESNYTTDMWKGRFDELKVRIQDLTDS